MKEQYIFYFLKIGMFTEFVLFQFHHVLPTQYNDFFI